MFYECIMISPPAGPHFNRYAINTKTILNAHKFCIQSIIMISSPSPSMRLFPSPLCAWGRGQAGSGSGGVRYGWGWRWNIFAWLGPFSASFSPLKRPRWCKKTCSTRCFWTAQHGRAL